MKGSHTEQGRGRCLGETKCSEKLNTHVNMKSKLSGNFENSERGFWASAITSVFNPLCLDF